MAIIDKLHVFVSSVQRELENERIAVTELISLDPFLDRHVKPILFELLAASSQPAEQAYLEALPRAVERAFQFLKRNMRHTTRIEGFSKVEIDEYPYEALREAVVNAVAHRDYDLAGSCIRRDGHFTVVFPGPGDHILELKSQHAHPVFEVADDVLKNLSETQRSIIQLLLAERKARVPDLADRLGLSQQAIRKALKALKARKLVLQVGKARETAYLLNERQFE